MKQSDDIDDDDEFLDELDITDVYNHLVYLRQENQKLKDTISSFEIEKRSLESNLFEMQKEFKRVRGELERMRAPPLIVGTLREVLLDNKAIVKSSTGPDFVVQISDKIDSRKLIPGSRVALDKDVLTIVGVLTSAKHEIVSGAEIIDKPDVKFDDIGGLDREIMETREVVELPLLNPDIFKKIGVSPPKGVLLVGPPGTGKTLIAKAIATVTNARFIRMVGSELVQKYIGEGSRLVRELFQMAEEKAPSIIFIDEIDAIGAKRIDMATSGDREVQRTLMQLLAEIDGFNPLGNVKIIAATNRPDILDHALLRPGRFDRIIEIGLPDLKGRKQIFNIHTSRMNIAKNLNIERLAAESEGFSGADIFAVCMEAGMLAIRYKKDVVTEKYFDMAMSKVRDRSNMGDDSNIKNLLYV